MTDEATDTTKEKKKSETKSKGDEQISDIEVIEAELDVKVDDRVTRREVPGPQGTVRAVRIDSGTNSTRKEDRGVLIGVQWDNGSYSYLTPEGVARV